MDMSKYSREDIIRMVEDEDVEFIRLQFTDIFGILKNVAITASQLDKALNNDCMFDGSAIEGFVRIDESDMYLHLLSILRKYGYRFHCFPSGFHPDSR